MYYFKDDLMHNTEGLIPSGVELRMCVFHGWFHDSDAQFLESMQHISEFLE